MTEISKTVTTIVVAKDSVRVVDAMSNDEAYELCFPKHKASSNEIESADLDFDVAEMPYALEFRSTSNYSRKHKFEGNKVPFSSE